MHAIKGVPQPQRRYARPQAVIVRMQANVFRSNQAGRLNTFSSCVRLRRKKRGARTYGGCCGTPLIACVRLRRLWAANRTYGSGGGHKKEPAKQALFQG